MIKKSTLSLNRISTEIYQNQAQQHIAIILDNVRSGHNVGSVFRTADGFGVSEMALCGICPMPPHKEILKTALGSTQSVKWRYFEKTVDAINHFKSLGYTIVAIEQINDSHYLNNIEIDQTKKYALIYGNEVDGIGTEALAHCDIAIEIPQIGTKHSLNMSISAGITLWEFFKSFHTKS